MQMTAASLYGANPQMPTAASSPLQHAAADDVGGGLRSIVNPHNPLLWFGVALAVTAGAMGVAGSARVGSVAVSAKAGKS